eukprot:Gb_11780 [translate_table: standard]
MATEDDKEDKQLNACCQKWKQKLIKAENGRRMLREAIRLLENGIQKIQGENDTLKKECEKEQKWVEDENKRTEEEKRLRVELEKEHNSLKLEFAAVIKRLNNFESQKKIEKDSKEEHAESEREHVIAEKRLKELLEKERQRAELESKRAEEMKKQADADKRKAEKEKKHADSARKKAEEERKCAELERRKFEEEKKRADAERKKTEDEKRTREMLEKKLQHIELQKKRGEEGKENAIEEKRLKDILEKERHRAEVERKKAEEVKKQADAEKMKAEEEKKHAESARKKAEEEKKRAESARKKAEEEKKRAEVERRKFEEERKQADAERKNAENEKLIRKMLENKLQQLELESAREEEGKICHNGKENAPVLLENMDRKKTNDEKRMKEHLEKERQQLKSERKMAEEEKTHREALDRQQSLLKEELSCVFRRLSCLESQLNGREVEHLQMGVGSVDDPAIPRIVLPQSKKLSKTAATESSRMVKVLTPNQIQGGTGFDCSRLAKKILDPAPPVYGGNFIEHIPGISCTLEPSIGGSIEKKVQSSALHSAITSFSDRQLVESQGRDAIIASNSSEVGKHKRKREKDLLRGSSATAEKVCNKVLTLPGGLGLHKDMIEQDENRSYVSEQRDDVKKLSRSTGAILRQQASRALKKRTGGGTRKSEPESLVDSIAHLFHKERATHFMIEEKLIALREALRVEWETSFDRGTRKSEPESLVDSIAHLFHKERATHFMIEEKLIALREALRVERETSFDLLSLTRRSIKCTRKRKRNTANKLSYKLNDEEDMEYKEQTTKQCKTDQCMKEDWSGNCPRIHAHNQDNESHEYESWDKKQTHVREICGLLESGTSCDQAREARDEWVSNLIEVDLNEQRDIMNSEYSIDFDIKRMLELDNESDEELYLQAKQSLLSPTLPEIPSPGPEDFGGNNFEPFSEEAPCKAIGQFTSKDSCSGGLEINEKLCSHDCAVKTMYELENNSDQNCYLRAKQSLLSPTFPEKPVQALEGNCFDSGYGVFETNRTIVNQGFYDTVNIVDGSLSLDSIMEDDRLGNLQDNIQCESFGQEMNEHEAVLQFSQQCAPDVQNIGSSGGGNINDLLSKNNSVASDAMGFKSIQPGSNKQTGPQTGVSCENQLTENFGLNENEVVVSSIEWVQESRLKCEAERQAGFTESDLQQVEEVTEKCEDESTRQIVDDDKIMGSCKVSHSNYSSRQENSLVSCMGSESIQPGFEKQTGSGANASCGNGLPENSSLDVVEFGKRNFEEENEIRVEFKDGRQRDLSGGQEQRSFSDFWTLSSCSGDENTFSSIFSNTNKYMGDVFDASWKDLDLERLVLSFALETKLLREDRACILISALMHNLASIETRNEAGSLCSPDHSSFWSKNLISQINKGFFKG